MGAQVLSDPGGVVAPRRCEPSGFGRCGFRFPQPVVALRLPPANSHEPSGFTRSRSARGTVPFSRRERQFSCDVLSAAKIGTVARERLPTRPKKRSRAPLAPCLAKPTCNLRPGNPKQPTGLIGGGERLSLGEGFVRSVSVPLKVGVCLDAGGVSAVSPGRGAHPGISAHAVLSDPGGVVAPRRCEPSGFGRCGFRFPQPVVALRLPPANSHEPSGFTRSRSARGAVPFSRRERQFSCGVLSAAKIGTVPWERLPSRPPEEKQERSRPALRNPLTIFGPATQNNRQG